MKEFDFKAAWRELAKPAFESLAAPIRHLYDRVQAEASDLHQGTNLLVPWPETDLKQSMTLIDDHLLAEAAIIIHSYGHWAFGEEPQRSNGEHWKFANYADQLLASACKLPPPHSSRHADGFGFYVCDGELRFYFSCSDSWSWEKVTLATPAGLQAAREYASVHVCPEAEERASKMRGRHQKNYERVSVFEARRKAMREALWPEEGPAAGYGDLGRFMTERKWP